ncbi:MAG: NTP transferase domain-containing protein, partial [Bdellovibrionales bacterium]|nr:NTP transferase domain-containing protein [Bdellovibrionales bacterium]
MTAIVIPSRYGSSRLPGKPLAEINGHSLLFRVWSIAKAVPGVSEVLVATDDNRIFDHVNAFGGNAVMTNPDCQNGSERVLDAIDNAKLDIDTVVNLQGDAPLTPPWVLEAIVNKLQSDSTIKIATPAVRLSRSLYEKVLKHRTEGSTTGTLVTFSQSMSALYFSRYPIPFLREDDPHAAPYVHKHLGIYGYQVSTLREYV